jgi:hypothetical protein
MANGAPRPNGRQIKGRGRGVVDLTPATLTAQEAREVQEQLEHALGARCNGCGKRIGLGFKFVSVDPRHQTPVAEVYACTREDCGFAELARDGATFMEMLEFVWLDENGIDADGSMAVRRRNLASQGLSDEAIRREGA